MSMPLTYGASGAGAASSLERPSAPRRRPARRAAVALVSVSATLLASSRAWASRPRPSATAAAVASALSSASYYCLLNALTGRYNCSLSAWDDDAVAADPYLINLAGDDDAFYSPRNLSCSDWDDDSVYNPESCESFDSGACQGAFDGPSITWPTNETYKGCSSSGTGCYTWCSDACDEGWWSWCLWDVVAHAPETCAGNYTSEGPMGSDDARRRLRTATGRTCGIHSYCDPCGDDNKFCKSMWDKYFVWGDSMCANKQVAAALEPASLEMWCEHWGLDYTAASG